MCVCVFPRLATQDILPRYLNYSNCRFQNGLKLLKRRNSIRNTRVQTMNVHMNVVGNYVNFTMYNIRSSFLTYFKDSGDFVSGSEDLLINRFL